MAKVSFTSHLKKWVEVESGDYPGATVREVIDRVTQENPKIIHYLLEDNRALRKHVVVFINGERIQDCESLSDPLGESDEIYIAQALSGG